MAQTYLLKFEEIHKDDVEAAGGKGANLGEMTNAGIPVPQGVVLTAQAYDLYMEKNGIDTELLMREHPNTEEAAGRIRNAIIAGNMPSEIEAAVRSFYEGLKGQARVAVRSSATAEDLADASFAGQQETYLNVQGGDMVLEKVKECYASLWGNRAVSYRKAQGYDQEKVLLAVVIQQMVESESAGVLFTKNPAGDADDILINASYGLGEAVVSGLVSPDEYVCARDGRLKSAVIGSKKVQIVYGESGTCKVPVSERDQKRQVLDAETIGRLVKEALNIEAHYGRPMDIEWAVRDGEIYILQARSITTIHQTEGRRFTDQDFASLPKIKKAKGRMRESFLFNLEKTPMPYYPLDHDFGGEVGIQKEVLFDELGLQLGGKMYPIDDDGISLIATGGVKVNRRIFQIPKSVKRMGDHPANMKLAKESLKDCRQRFEKLRETRAKNAREAGEILRLILPTPKSALKPCFVRVAP